MVVAAGTIGEVVAAGTIGEVVAAGTIEADFVPL
jgi:ABC-type proline/glycine betaine transport system permease subunit